MGMKRKTFVAMLMGLPVARSLFAKLKAATAGPSSPSVFRLFALPSNSKMEMRKVGDLLYLTVTGKAFYEAAGSVPPGLARDSVSSYLKAAQIAIEEAVGTSQARFFGTPPGTKITEGHSTPGHVGMFIEGPFIEAASAEAVVKVLCQSFR